MDVLIVGAGEMGRWFGEMVDADLAFADADPAVAAAAAEAVGGRAVALDADARFDAVCVAVPLPAAADAITEHAPKAERALLDVTGEMADPVAAMADAAPEKERVSLHPLFAAANAPGTVAVVADAPGSVSDRLLDDLRAAGNELAETTPAEHDAAMETVQAGAHAAVLAFALAAEDVPEGLTTPVFEELSSVAARVTGNDPRVYAEIQAAFEGADRVAAAARRLADADDESFADLYREAGRRLDARTEDDP